MRGLEGKVVLVTGAASGMGRAAAIRFVEERARVVCADIDEEEGEKLAAELGTAATFVRLDVSSEADWQHAVPRIEDIHGRVDVLVNNAGILGFGSVPGMALDEYRRLVDVNQVGVFLGMKHTAPALERAGGGAIINVSSVEGLGGDAYLTAYSATKFAVRGMTKSAAWEFGRKNIRVNSIHPGAIRTPMVEANPHFGPEAEAFVASKTALKRFGEPEEVAALMAFLASADASYVTGAEIAVDGGVSASSGFAV